MHISYVRSVNMDEWKPKELKKMQLGGNSKMNSFLKKYGVSKETPIPKKYHTKAAEIYREVMSAAAEGRKYTPPSPAEVQVSKHTHTRAHTSLSFFLFARPDALFLLFAPAENGEQRPPAQAEDPVVLGTEVERRRWRRWRWT